MQKVGLILLVENITCRCRCCKYLLQSCCDRRDGRILVYLFRFNYRRNETNRTKLTNTQTRPFLSLSLC